MPQPRPAARPDLAALVAHYRDLLGLRDWTITARWAEPEEIGSALAKICPLPERRIADLIVSTACPPEELRATVAHELVHALISPLANVGEWSGGALMLEEQAVEALALAITRAEGLPTEAAVMRRALANLPSRLRARLAARPTITRSRMDGKAVLEAVKTQDGAAALTILDGWLVEMIKGAMGDAGMPAEEAAPLEGEDGAAMMRRVLKSALARTVAPAVTLVDTGFSAKVLARLGAKTEGEALLRIAALKIADSQVGEMSATDEMRARKALVVEALKRTGLARSAFYVDGKDELLPEWTDGTVEQLERTLATLKRGGTPIVRTPVEPDPAQLAGGGEIPGAVQAYVARRRITDPKKIEALARALPNSGNAPQES